jgi:hypothetical protein
MSRCLLNHADAFSKAYTYASGLELNSPRFSQPGDFFTYVVFVATTLLVSVNTQQPDPSGLLFRPFSPTPRNICPPSAFPS